MISLGDASEFDLHEWEVGVVDLLPDKFCTRVSIGHGQHY